MLKSQIYLCYSVQPCVKEGGKCKVYRCCYHRDLLYDGDGLMHRRMTTIQFFWFTGERRGSELISGGARILLSSFRIPSFYWGRCRVISIRQQTKSSCQHMLLSRDITPAGLGGESLWHAHTVTASADTSWDIRLVRVEYKQEEAGTFFLKKASNLFVFFFFLHYPMCRVC